MFCHAGSPSQSRIIVADIASSPSREVKGLSTGTPEHPRESFVDDRLGSWFFMVCSSVCKLKEVAIIKMIEITTHIFQIDLSHNNTKKTLE